MNLAQVIFRSVFRRLCLFHLQTQLASILTSFLARSNRSPIALDAESGSHFDQAFPETVNLPLFFCRRLYLVLQSLLLRFEFQNPVLQAVDPFVSLIEELFIEEELGAELILRR